VTGFQNKTLSQYARAVARYIQRAGFKKSGLLAFYHHEGRGILEEKKVTHLLGGPRPLAHIFPVFQPSQNLFNNGLFLPSLLLFEALTALASLFLLILQRLLDKLNILQSELLTDNVKVTSRVDISLNVDNFGIIETPYHLEDGIDGSDMRQKGIAKTSASGSTTSQTGDIIDRKVGWNL